MTAASGDDGFRDPAGPFDPAPPAGPAAPAAAGPAAPAAPGPAAPATAATAAVATAAVATATAAAAAADRCSTQGRALGDALIGTASTVRSWLLLEQPGPWESAAALASRRLPAGLGAELARRANRHRVRIVLIRRPGRTAAGGGRTCFVASSRVSGSWLGEVRLDAAEDVLDVDLSTLAAGHVDGAATVEGPIFCVCTHGRHDPCCAERGRPVAAALAVEFPEQTWEISHIGGDRFAGNVVCLPDGDYLGAVTAEDAIDVARAYVDGDYTLDKLRGRSVYPPLVQAAEALVRQRLGVTGREAVRITGVDLAADPARVGLEVAGHGRLDAQVAVGASEVPRLLTCAATSLQQPPTYELVRLT